MEYDSIIIGSGMGGLTTAAALVLCGERVLVLEQHDRLGGYIHSFARKKWHWNIGTHYLGRRRPGDAVDNLFRILTQNSIEMEPLGAQNDVLTFPGETVEIPAGIDEIQQLLCDKFPDEARQIRRFYGLVDRIGSQTVLFVIPHLIPIAISNIAFRLLALPFNKYRNKTIKQVVDEMFSNGELKKFLYYQSTKAGVNPKTTSFLFFCLVNGSLKLGGCYPTGGGDSIVNALADLIRSKGGKLQTRSEVTKIVVSNGAASGVLLADGTKISAENIVSNIGIKETITHLIDPRFLPRRYLDRLSRYTQSDSYLTLFVGLEGNITEVGAGPQNYRIFFNEPLSDPGDPTDENWKPSAVAIVFQSLRDKKKRSGTIHTCEVMVPMAYNPFSLWAHGRPNHRGDEYKAFKERTEKKLLKVLTDQFPGIDAYIKHLELGTPVTYEHYCHHESGACLGMSVTPEKFNDMSIRPASPIKGLFYTGADVFGFGITGTFISGISTASKITGRNLFRRPPGPDGTH